MDELDRIHALNRALIDTRAHLLNQSPTDMVAIAHITERVVGLTEAHLAKMGAPARQLTGAEQQELEQRIAHLRQGLGVGVSAREIVGRSERLCDLVPWPP